MFEASSVFPFIIRVFAVFTALPIHEFAHAFVANKLGDPTAKNSGRLTLNPLTHLDLFGALMILLVGFGYAKPVPVNPAYFKNPRRGMALTSLAGPLSNFLLAYFFMVLYKVWVFMIPETGNLDIYIDEMLITLMNINVMLAVFNLLPIPPLDGSRIIDFFLPESLSRRWHQLERRAGMFLVLIVFVLLRYDILTKPLLYFQKLAYAALLFLTGWIDLLGENFSVL